MTIEEQFAAEINEKIATMRRELNWIPGQLLLEIQKHGMVGAAKRLVAPGNEKIQEGLVKLTLLGRLDLTVESIMKQPKYKSLFTPLERQEAARRVTPSKVK